MSRYYFRVFADYFTFEILDEGISPPRGLWNETTLLDRVATANGVIDVATVRNMFVPVLIEVLNSEDVDHTLSPDTWDHIVECSIATLTGSFVVLGTTDYYPDAPRVKVAPATYQARIYYGGLSTLSDDGLTGNDVYWVVLRPGPPIEPRVIKRWEGTGSV